VARLPAGRSGLPDDLKARAQAWVERSCLDQNLPVKVEDPSLLSRVAELLGSAAVQERQTGRKRDSSKRL
jgi:hypothetical protein